MRILIVTQYFWPENFRINDLVAGLLERGHTVDVLTGKPNYPEGRFFDGYSFWGKTRESYLNSRVFRVPLFPRGKGSGVQLAINFLSFAFFGSVFAPFFCKARYDVIFVFEPSPITVAFPALLLKKIKKVPVVLWVQDLWPESLEAAGAVRSPRVLGLVGKMVRFIYQGCDKILGTSRSYLPSIHSYGIPPEKTHYYPQSVESLYRQVPRAEVQVEDQLMPPGFRVVFAGNIGAAQSFETILGAAELLKDNQEIKIIVIGDGRERAAVEKEVVLRGLENTVHLLGRYPVDTMPRFFGAADALLVTLKKEPIFSLTVPGKVQSYFACGKPIIASIDGEAQRIIRESGAGLVGAAEDSESLANNILELWRMSEKQRQRMGDLGYAYYQENFDRERLLNDLETLLAEVTHG